MILDFGEGFSLRQANAADHADLAMVCLKTGDAGQDATAREDDPQLLGLIFAIPYQVLEPDFAFVVDGPNGVSGYVLGAPDTQAFNARLAAEWYPRLQERAADSGLDPAQWRGSDWCRHVIHHPDFGFPAALAAYPSHGHIDLLPQARGRGIGRRAMAVLEQRLAAVGSSGLFMQLDLRNDNALAFYRAVGFEVLRDDLPTHSTFMGKRLGDERS